MKWKLTFSFTVSIVFIVIIVIVTNLAAITLFSFFGARQSDMDWFFYGTEHTSYLKPEEYVRNFSEDIEIVDGKIQITEDGKKSLEKNRAWIQILDRDGKEVYSYQKENSIPTKYTPMELIHNYKYANPSTLFVNEKVIDEYAYSYLIGFPYNSVGKQVIIYNKQQLRRIIGSTFVLILGVDLIIALIFALYFSNKLTKPVQVIIDAIRNLHNKDYKTHYDENGLYKEVYSNINNLAFVLGENEIERKNLERMREEWFANISHDIKTPLSTIKGYAELLGSAYDFTEEEIKEYSQLIEEKAGYIKELVDDLNLSTRLKNKHAFLNLTKHNIVEVIRHTIIDMLNTPENSNANIEFTSSIEGIEREMDSHLFKRAVNNILYNAIAHNDEDVRVNVNIQNTKGGIQILIGDNGKGIAKDELEYIFTRYYRGTNTGMKHEGSGLGMAIAKDIINAHGGDILVESELGKGTIFKIIIP